MQDSHEPSTKLAGDGWGVLGSMTIDQAGRMLPILTGKPVSPLIPELE